MALGAFSLLVNPATARAESEEKSSISELEKYHIVVPLTTAKLGGSENFLLRSGETCTVKIPPRTQENDEIAIAGRGLAGQDIQVIIHTLYDRPAKITAAINEEIDKKTPFIQEVSKEKCQDVYTNIEEAKDFDDLTTLDFLDYIISSSNLDNQIKQCYKLASENWRLIKIQQALEDSLEQSNLTESEQQQIKGAYAYVRAGEPVPDFNALTALNSIIANSILFPELQARYSVASAESRALTVDLLIIQAISESPDLTAEQKSSYLSTYQLVRAGEIEIDEAELTTLDTFIYNSSISENAQAVYFLAREQNIKKYKNWIEATDAFLQESRDVKKLLDRARNQGSALVPNITKSLSVIGTETATGVTISNLSGAAATNATLAFLGGGSVASGGFGMLGGLAVATGGAALIGAAGLLSLTLVSEMDIEDKKNLGIAIGAGTFTGATSVLGAWTAAGALGVAGTSSGAAAISSLMAALGGLSVLTGGAALVASGTAFLVWSSLSNSKKRDQSDLRELEARTYTLSGMPSSGSLEEFIQNKVIQISDSDKIFYAPDILPDKLAIALGSKWLSLKPNENVLVFIDSIRGNDSKQSIVFTEQRLFWFNHSMKYAEIGKFFETEAEFVSILTDKKQKSELAELSKAISILSNENYKTDLSQMKELVSLLDKKSGLEELLQNQKEKKNLDKLKRSVDILLDTESNKDLVKLKEAIAILSSLPDFIKFLPSRLATVFSDKQFRDDLVGEVIALFPSESGTEDWVKLLQDISQKYS